MHVVLPELDGRLFAGVVSFKEQDDLGSDLGLSLLKNAPYQGGVSHVADLAEDVGASESNGTLRAPRRPDVVDVSRTSGPDRTRGRSRCSRKCFGIAGSLEREGYAVSGVPTTTHQSRWLGLTSASQFQWPVADYDRAFAELPPAFKDSVTAAWGQPDDDGFCIDGMFVFRAVPFGNLIVGLQPERGQAHDRKAQYHDPATPPRHSYVTFISGCVTSRISMR